MVGGAPQGHKVCCVKARSKKIWKPGLVTNALLVFITHISLKPDGKLIVLVLTTKKQFLQVSV
jgi:hypothetical protein